MSRSAVLPSIGRPRRPGQPAAATGSLWLRSPSVFWGLTLAHGMLALVFRSVPQIGLLHVALVVLLGTRAILTNRDSIVPVLAYLVGCEVIWRANGVPTLWETGKLLCLAWAVLAMLRWGRRSMSASLLFIVSLLLLPGVVMSWNYHRSLDAWRAALTTEFAGTAFLALGTTMLLSVRPQPRMIRTLAAALVPISGFALQVLWSLLTAEELQFTTESNFATSAGYGPVQVSSLLGFAFLCALVLAIQIPVKMQRWMMFGAALFLLILAVFTFSRTGTYSAVFGVSVLAIHTSRDPRRALTLAIGASMILLLSLWLILPRLNEFSGGMLSARYQDTASQSRVRMVQSDLKIFRENPLLGLGAGVSRFGRSDPTVQSYASHTEFTRVLADHGVLGGAVYLVVFLFMGVLYLQQPSLMHRACAATAAVAGAVVMASIAQRMALPSFCFVFATSLLLPLDDASP